MTEETPRKKPGPKPKAAMNKLLEAAENLSPEERNLLESYGFILPRDVAPDALDQRPSLGYYCKKCGDIAFYFVGKTFTQSDGGEGKYPDLRYPIQQLPFIQPHLPKERVNRHKPICQKCYQEIHHNQGKLDPRRVIAIDEWSKARDKAFEEMRKLKNRRFENTSVPWPQGTSDRPGNPKNFSKEGTFADTAENREAGLAGQPYLDATDKAAIEAAADATDLNSLRKVGK